ncbi:DedA family protein [Candidatus Woesearchaeota archaeon]|nr:DedA family protein [Candidatus Woesearchaeota archaeon]
MKMIKKIIDFILHIDQYLNVLIQNYGNLVYIFLFMIIFMETGFVVTPFLPGDSLLFVAGALAATGSLNVYIIFLLLSIAAILGDTVNYALGKYFGEKVFSRFIKKDHLEKTKLFFNKYGKKTIILARFIPIIRTFAPFVAGIGKMNYFTFLSYNIIGGIVWVGIFIFAGFFFGNVPIIKENLSIIIILIIIVSIIPAVIEYFKIKRSKN